MEQPQRPECPLGTKCVREVVLQTYFSLENLIKILTNSIICPLIVRSNPCLGININIMVALGYCCRTPISAEVDSTSPQSNQHWPYGVKRIPRMHTIEQAKGKQSRAAVAATRQHTDTEPRTNYCTPYHRPPRQLTSPHSHLDSVVNYCHPRLSSTEHRHCRGRRSAQRERDGICHCFGGGTPKQRVHALGARRFGVEVDLI